ncbi:MAG TPA: hypothetical protein VGK63_01095 [Candidatus Limnocylindrales bacterium]
MSLGASWRGARPRQLAALIAIWFATATFAAGPAEASTTYSRNLWTSSALVYQDPYYTACTAAAAMIMLNTIALRGTGGDGFTWRPTTAKSSTTNPRSMVSILAWERANDTLATGGDGSDAHGWRNALNYYGWGDDAWQEPSRMVYEDRTYSSFWKATHAAVRAIARYDMPVGILAWGGGHAQVMTGYVVRGANPRTSNDFALKYVWFTDPLKSDGYVNHRVSRHKLRDGNLKFRFRWYVQTDSPKDDPLTAGYLRSAVASTVGPSEWYHRWTLVLPVREPAPASEPTPTPTPKPTTTPTGTPKPSDTPAPTETAAP